MATTMISLALMLGILVAGAVVYGLLCIIDPPAAEKVRAKLGVTIKCGNCGADRQPAQVCDYCGGS